MKDQKHLGKYEILDEIGKGGFATVYRARDTVLGREVALKVLDPLLMRDGAFVDRFKREARAAASLTHPHIVTIHDLGEADGRLYIALELIKEADLVAAIAQRGRIPWDETMRIVSQIADALTFAHGHDLVHRDLKPANVLLDPQRGAVVTDFGFAKALGSSSTSLTASGGVVGTPAYIPPEIWDGEGATPATDVYALACLTYEMLTGQPLFTGATPSAIMRRHFQPPEFPEQWPPDVPDGVGQVLLAAIGQNPAERTATPAQFAAALQGLGSAAILEPDVAELEQTAPESTAPTPQPAAYPESRPDEVACSTCGHLNRTNAQYCQACGHSLLVSASPLQPVNAPPLKKVLSNAVRPAMAEVQSPLSSPSQSRPKSKRLVWIVGGIVAILVLCCIVAVVGGLLGGKDTTTQATDAPSTVATVFPTNTSRPTTAPTQTPKPAATSTQTPRPSATPMPTTTPTPAPGDVVLAESFSGADSEARWELWNYGIYDFRIEGGKLVAVGSDPDGFARVESIDTYSDLDLQIDATIREGGTEGVFGIVFALDSSEDNFKVCRIRGDDSADCGENVNGEFDSGDWMSVDLSSHSDANVMRLIVADDQWALYVNAQCVGSGESQFVGRRRIGLVVSTASEDSSATIEYDNLIIRVPDDDSKELLVCEPTPYTSESPSQPTQPPASGGMGTVDGTIYLSSQASTATTCRISVWGNGNDFIMDAGLDSPASRQTSPGEYWWRVYFGRSDGPPLARTMQLPPGGQCSVTCYDEDNVHLECSP